MNLAMLTLILKGLDIVAAALVAIPELKARYDAYRAKIQVFVDEDRSPTPEEFAELVAESDDLTEAIKAAAAAKIV